VSRPVKRWRSTGSKRKRASDHVDRVLFVANEGKFSVGAPTVANVTIKADVVEHFRGEKKIASR